MCFFDFSFRNTFCVSVGKTLWKSQNMSLNGFFQGKHHPAPAVGFTMITCNLNTATSLIPTNGNNSLEHPYTGPLLLLPTLPVGYLASMPHR